MKTLIISYLPRLGRSHTAGLLEHFIDRTVGLTAIERIDLLQAPPPVFSAQSLDAYVRRQYLGEPIGAADAAALGPFDTLVAQFKAADVVVLACPMHNFSFPGIVKSYLDAVMLKGETWNKGPAGYTGLMTGRRALLLSASGGPFLDPPSPRDHLTTLGRLAFEFMGFSEIETVLAEGMNLGPEVGAASRRRCQAEIDAVCARWYLENDRALAG